MFSSSIFSQIGVNDTTWFDASGSKALKNNSKYYRFYKRIDNQFLVTTKYSKGANQMIAYASSIDPELVKDGFAIYYNEDGTTEKKGNYVNNKKVGTWIYYFDQGKDSSITLHKSDGTQEMIRRSAKDTEIFTIVEHNAQFPGGIAAMMEFIKKNTNYPDASKKYSLGGKVFLKFVVDEQGEISNVEILKGSGVLELDEEAKRVVRLMPQWSPATMTGRPVKCYFNLPFSFSIEEPYFMFNTNNNNDNYLLAKASILKNNLNEAMDFLYKDIGDVDAWYNLGVIYYLKRNKIESKKYFENVTANSDPASSIRKASEKFLKTSF